MYETRQFRKGLKVEIDGVPFEVVDFQHVSPGKGSAFTRTKVRNMLTGNVVERTYKSGEKLASANTAQREMQFLYTDSAGYHLMDNSNYEQLTMTEDQLGDAKLYLQENLVVNVTFFNDRPIGVDLPNFIEAEIVQTEPSFRGDTVSGGGKPAKIKSGAVVQVPFHLKEGDVIKVDTRDCRYVERVNR